MRSVKQLRHNRLLKERTFSVDYLMNQPMFRLVALINQYAEVFLNSRARDEFKLSITRMLNLVID